MIKGQLVEIPATSALYHSPRPDQMTTPDVMRGLSPHHRYSLFDGFLVGEHRGTSTFQLGQRKRIGVGGKSAPLYVIGIDEAENRVFVGQGDDHPGMFSKVLCFKASQFHPVPNPSFNQILTEEATPVDVVFSDGNKAEANMYCFGSELFLEFKKPVSISFSASDISVFKEDTLIANIL